MGPYYLIDPDPTLGLCYKIFVGTFSLPRSSYIRITSGEAITADVRAAISSETMLGD